MNQARLDELNQQLYAIVVIAQRHPSLSRERRSALRQLVNEILQSGRLCRPQKGKFLGTYDDIYTEAVQELLLYICKNIDKYNSKRGTVMTWVNMLLERRFFREAIPRVLGKPGMQRVALSDLENLAAPGTTTTLADTLKESVEADPEGLLKSAHIRNYPEATFQVLLQRRLSGQSWDAIASDLGIGISTISNFYYRCVSKFSVKLKEYCSVDSS